MKVLVVDDCRDTVEIFMTLLQEQGHEVCTAYSAEAAITVASNERPDIALLDIVMPDGDGFVLASRLRALAPKMSLIAITGWQRSAATAEQIARFDHYLLKPIHIEALVSLLDQCRPHLAPRHRARKSHVGAGRR
jgi:two-component system, sensor histidine kinase